MTDFLNGVYRSQITIRSRVGEVCPRTQKGEWAFASLMAGSAKVKWIEPGSTLGFTVPLERFFQLHAGKWLLDCKVIVFGKDADRSVQLPQLEFYLPDAEKK